MNDKQPPSNEIHTVGYPEGQLLANGATPEQTAEISAAILKGEELPVTGNEKIDEISTRIAANYNSLDNGGGNAPIY